ncbi:S-adenosylmethionine-dependent methyltransferase [Candidatus Hepatincola sp. Pdp]
MLLQKASPIVEPVLNLFGLTLSSRRVNHIFQVTHITNNRVVNLKRNLDKKSISVIDALIYIANNKHKSIYKSKHVALYSKFYNMSFLHRLYYRLKYKIPFNLKILQEVFHYQCGLQFLSKQELNFLNGKSVITAGAYWGDSSLILNHITKGKVYGFEPNKHNFSLFQQMISKNSKHGAIIPINKGLSEMSGVAYINDDTLSVASKLSDSIGSKIETISIDDFVKQNNIVDLGVIHLDIEGLETKVLLGATKTIKQFKPTLLVSIYHNPQDFFDLKPLIESWNLGYNFKIRKLARNRFEVVLIAIPTNL